SFVLLLQPHPTSPLFPYTTLFRSLAAPRRRAQPVERGPAAGAVSRRAERRQPLALEPVDVCADLENWNRQLVSAGDELVHADDRSEEHTSELQSRSDLVCRLLLEK